MSTEPRGAIFVMPVPSEGDSGPVSPWMVAAGWAGAARRRWGRAWIVTPEGTLSPEAALARASRPALAANGQPRRWRRYVPEPAVTAVKDLRQLRRARAFGRTVAGGPWLASHVAFVWQHHGLFHTAGRRIAARLGRPLVAFVDAPQVWEDQRWGVRRPGWTRLAERVGERPSLLASDLVACVSDEVAQAVTGLGVPRDRVLVTPNGVDLERFSPDVSGDAVRSRLGLHGKLVVGWVGSFRPFHGLERALEAHSLVKTVAPDAALLLVGDGQQRPALERLVARRGLEDVVFTGTVPYEEIPAYVAAMDIALLLGDEEHGFHYSPLKLREYMACGTPVVASRVGEVGRVLSDGSDALLLDDLQPETLANAIERLYREPPLRAALSRAGRAKATADWSWDMQLERVLAALRDRFSRGSRG